MYQVQTTSFIAPSGVEYTIREQNGQDEEVLTNLAEVKRYMVVNNFLQGIIQKTSFKNGQLTLQEVLDIPWLDRQCILFKSRIFSIGEILEFSWKWPGMKNGKLVTNTVEYEQDLNEYLYSDYSSPQSITDEELASKPLAIPFYMVCPEDDGYFYLTLKSGKQIRFRRLDGNSELYIVKLNPSEQTRNTSLIARNLELKIDDKWERVYNFSLFSVKDMQEIRKSVSQLDPDFAPVTEITNPETEEVQEINLLTLSSFFFPGEDA